MLYVIGFAQRHTVMAQNAVCRDQMKVELGSGPTHRILSAGHIESHAARALIERTLVVLAAADRAQVDAAALRQIAIELPNGSHAFGWRERLQWLLRQPLNRLLRLSASVLNLPGQVMHIRRKPCFKQNLRVVAAIMGASLTLGQK